MARNVLTDTHVQGALSASSFTPPAGCIDNAAIEAAAGIDATKVIHQFAVSRVQGSTAAADTAPVHIANQAGTIVGFEIAAITPCSTGGGDDRTVTVDLKKNGTTVLTAPIVLNKTIAAYAVVSATLASDSYAAGDVLSIVTTVGGSTGTLAAGVIAQAFLRENP